VALNNFPTVYIIEGPTAAGKTAVAIALARRLGTAIISADSRQCYKEVNIGVAKPSIEELQAVKHYFIDEFPITTSLTAADYETLALGYLEEIFKTHSTAVVCGGTGLYIQALCEGLDEMPPVDPEIERAVTDEYSLKGIEWLQQAMQQEDPAFYESGEIHNPARLLRALSFVRTTGRSIIEYRTRTKKARPFRIIKVGLQLPREQLYARINERVESMMDAGLLREAEQLLPFRHLKNMQTVGYVELFAYFDGKYTLQEATDKIKQHTRNYAKRQMTWFARDKEVHWFPPDDKNIIERILAL
jgi:tRNA dimethylallyltransferase